MTRMYNIYLLTCSSITLLNGSWCGRVGGDVMEDKLLYRELQSPAVTALLLESRMDCAEVFIDKVGFNRFQFINWLKQTVSVIIYFPWPSLLSPYISIDKIIYSLKMLVKFRHPDYKFLTKEMILRWWELFKFVIFSFIFWIIIIVNILCLRSSSTVPDLSYLLPILPAQCWFWIRTLKPRLRGGRFLVCSPNHSNPLANLDVIASSISSPDTPLRPRSGRLTGNPW